MLAPMLANPSCLDGGRQGAQVGLCRQVGEVVFLLSRHPVFTDQHNLIERGLDPQVCRLFIIDGAKALSKVIRRTFGAHTPIQRCQIHKARNVIERLPKPLHASVRRALRQAWELDDADKAERLLRNLARRLDQEAPGVAASILEGLDEMLTVNRLGLPVKLRRSLACTNSIENMMGTVRRVCRNVMAKRRDGVALDRRRHDGGSQRLPSIESLQAPAHS